MAFLMPMRQQQQEKPKKPLPMLEAQADHLRQLTKVVEGNQRQTFARGDFVRYLPATGPINNDAEAATMTLMFWRWLDGSHEDERRIQIINPQYLLTLSKIDCLLIVFDSEDVGLTLGGSEFLIIDDRIPADKPVDTTNPG